MDSKANDPSFNPSELTVNRPKLTEDDEELLRMQEMFLSSKHNPAATVVKNSKSHKPDIQNKQAPFKRDVVDMQQPFKSGLTEASVTPQKKSRFQEQKKNSFTKDTKPNQATVAGDTNLDKASVARVLSSIIERDTKHYVSHDKPFSLDGFPKAPSLQIGKKFDSTSAPQAKKKSLFAQQFEQRPCSDFSISNKPMYGTASTKCNLESSYTPPQSIVSGFGLSASNAEREAKAIHAENLNKLSSMTEKEILMERQKLLSMLDPSLINFLKTRKSENLDSETTSTSIENQDDSDKSELKPVHKLNEDELPVKPDSQLVHMDNVEYEKLAWMKDLPPVNACSTKGKPARFDFQGFIIPEDAEIPVDLGLHHHGEEAERAGYTLDELFHLCRSLNSQQRTFALKTLGCIITNAKSGMFEESIEGAIIPSVINAGIVFLLRWALDDKITTVLISAVFCLHALLTNSADENSLQFTFCWYRGGEVAAHQVGEDTFNAEKEKLDFLETVEVTDADEVQADVVRALVKSMNLLPRLRFLLEVWDISPESIKCILEILCRISYHSKQEAYNVYKCPRLMEFIFKELLPSVCSTDDKTVSSIISTLKLIKVLCQAGRSMATDIVTNYKLMDKLLLYIAPQPSEMNLPENVAYELQTVCYNIWQVCLSYGLTGHYYSEFYPQLVTNTHTILAQYQNITDTSFLRESAILGVLESAVQLAGAHSRYHQKLAACKRQKDSQEPNKIESLIVPSLHWTQVLSLIDTLEILFQSILQNISEKYHFKKFSLNLATSVINFVASFYELCPQQSDSNVTNILTHLEQLCNSVIFPLWSTLGFRSIIASLASHSNILNHQILLKTKHPKNLLDLGCQNLIDDSKTLPILAISTPFGFVTALFRLFSVIGSLHKGLADKFSGLIVNDPDIRSYITAVVKTKPTATTFQHNYFTRFENHCQYFLLKTISMSAFNEVDTPYFLLCHQLSLLLLTRLHDGDEHFAHDLLSLLIFNRNFIALDSDVDSSTHQLSCLSISDGSGMVCSNSQLTEDIKFKLLQHSISSLKDIRANYLSSFSQMESAVLHSKARCFAYVEEVHSFLVGKLGETLLPRDWIFMPLVHQYSLSNSLPENEREQCSPQQINKITHALKFIYLLETQRPSIMDGLSASLKISRLMCVFLADNNIFLEPVVRSYLAGLMRIYSKENILDSMNFDESIPGLYSFYDFFIEFLKQYISVSFGDFVFGSYLLLPLQQMHNVFLRKAIWEENSIVLRTLRVSIQDHLIPIHRYLVPEETNPELLKLLILALLRESVSEKWCPVLYLIAVHHCNRFMFRQDRYEDNLRQFMFSHVLKCSNSQLKEHLLHYKMYNATSNHCIELYQNLPHNRKSLLEKYC
ncbi:polymerase II-associated 1-like [Octopus vulgaris]|uniref:Polymerase II-associated 1-like n=1 Tax=Octopus vulgaris TaxID=6645 RepID=A0AA36AG54_OCTVU|nr:polymerase II-associated 1-like [Octopus vulgaris]